MIVDMATLAHLFKTRHNQSFLQKWLIVSFWLFSLQVFGHALEKISVTSIEQSGGVLTVKIKTFVEDLQPQLQGLDNEKKFNHYLRSPFDADMQKPVEQYICSQFQLSVRGIVLKPQFQALAWVEELKFTDHAMVLVTLSYDWPQSKKPQELKITNSIFLKNIYGQQNIVNVQIKELKESYVLVQGKESVIISI